MLMCRHVVVFFFLPLGVPSLQRHSFPCCLRSPPALLLHSRVSGCVARHVCCGIPIFQVCLNNMVSRYFCCYCCSASRADVCCGCRMQHMDCQ
jgi:hypothetical protein